VLSNDIETVKRKDYPMCQEDYENKIGNPEIWQEKLFKKMAGSHELSTSEESFGGNR